MNCPRCNAKVAFSKKQCDNCGQDLSAYRKIVSASNFYYNNGLEQARVRDLSGAVSSLKKSLEFNKLNTNARNLLGLIYFEMGEIVSALSEWVISKHFQAENNDADTYINAVQSDPNKLEMYNQTLKKYNAALSAAQHGDTDMAIIQLKKVVNLNPNFIRASQLLALLYMMADKKDNKVRAKKILVHVGQIDVTNTTTIRYLKELSDVHLKGEPAKVAVEKKKEPETRKVLPRTDADAYKTITPYKEEKPSILPFVNVVIGVVIGMALMGFLIIPHMQANKSDKENSDFKKYSEQMAASDSDVTSLKNENEKLTKELEKVKKQNEELSGKSAGGVTMKESYENLVEAMQYYVGNDKVNAAKCLSSVNQKTLSSKKAKELYDKIREDTFGEASNDFFTQGRDAYNGEGNYAGHQDYDKAIKLLERALKYNKDNADAMYFLGRCYQQKSEPDKAKEYYNRILDNYPTSPRVAEAQQRLRELGE